MKNKNIFLFLLSIFISFSLLAQEPQIDFSSIEDLSEVRVKNIQRIIDYKKRNSHDYTIAQIEALKIQLEDIAKSTTELTFVPRGTKLIEIKDNSLKYTQEDLHVRAHTLLDFEGFKYLQNKKGEITFKVLKSSTTSTKKVTTLYRGPEQFERIEKAIINDPDDKKLQIQYSVQANIGLRFLGVTKDLLQTSETSANTFGLHSNIYLSKTAPFFIGITTALDSLATTNNTGRVSLKTVGIGPVIKYSEIDSSHHFTLGARSALYSSIDSNDSTISSLNVSETSIEAGYQYEKKDASRYPLLYGVSFKRSWLKAKSEQGTFINPTNTFDNAITFSLGLKGGFLW